jgi:osmotically-inducible protein OsmY
VTGGLVIVSGEFTDEAERRVVAALTRTVPGVRQAVRTLDRDPGAVGP